MLLRVVFATSVLALLALAATVKPAPAMRVHERIAQPPTGFVAVGKVHDATPIRIRLGLKQNNIDGLVKVLYRVSDPAGADYGKYLSKEEVAAFMAPARDTLAAVTDWLAENGITAKAISPAGEWLEFIVPASKANALFAASFTTFKHTESGTTGIRTLKYSVPTALHAKIEAMLPGISFWTPSQAPKLTEVKVANPARRGGAAEKRQLPPCNLLITPTCLRQMYGVPATPATQNSSKLSVSGFIQQFANNDDLQLFLRTLRADRAGNTFATQLIDGGSNPQGAGTAGAEANLDTQYTIGVASGVPVTFVSVGPNNRDGAAGFLDIINFITSQSNPPKVLTTSYGADEFASRPLQNMLCNAYMSAGAQGISLIFSSGDGGVSGSQSKACNSFIPTFPSNCPYVTSVGATTGVPPTESAAAFSSGGFSNIFPTPAYQSAAVQAYKNQIGSSVDPAKFNASGRAFPDVAVQGVNYAIAYRGLFYSVDGTSASAPVFASMIALINDRRAAAGKPSLGFLNPLLYANPQVFNDITTGSNPGCGTNGFPALSGWDPVTGLGTPKFEALAAVAGAPPV